MKKHASLTIQIGIAATVISILIGVITILTVVLSINKKLVLLEERQSKNITAIQELKVANENQHNAINSRCNKLASSLSVHLRKEVE
jgi:hypothetical protein